MRSSFAVPFLFLSLFGCAASSSPSEAPQDTRSELQALSGTFRSTQAEDWGRGTYGFREFTFDRGRWSLRFTLALDPEMKAKVFEFRTLGAYEVGAASRDVPTAFETTFREEQKFVTLRASDPKLVEAFGLAACGLTRDVEKDVSVAGCALWKPVAVCGKDFDLLSLPAPTKLHFGVRPEDNDMCTPDKRPRALLPAVVRS